MKKILIIVPDLELNGAQTVLSELLQLYYFSNAQIDMISPSDGKYHEIYKNKNVNVSIRPYVMGDMAFRRHLQTDYDMVLINTSSCLPYLFYFFNTNVPVFVWLHESLSELRVENHYFPDPRLYSDNIHLCGVTENTRDAIYKIFGEVPFTILPMPIRDVSEKPYFDISNIDSKLLEKIDGKVLFFLPAAYTIIKGQDLMLKAIINLPAEYSSKAHFIFCGYTLPGQIEYYNSLKSVCEKLNNVTMLSELSRNDVYHWYQACDCVLAPSRVDTTPTTIVEAAMFSKLILLSDACGVSRYLKDCESAFIFPNENIEELTKRIMLIISDYNNLMPIANNGRKMYEEHFSTNSVSNVISNLFP